MGKPKNYCELCHVKNKAWSEGRFFGIASCKNPGCGGKPLIVLKEHRAELSEDEKEEMEQLAQKYWPGYRARDKGMRSILSHYHEHYIKNKK